MKISICRFCKKEFVVKYFGNDSFCSHKCYTNNNIGKRKSKETRDKIAKSNSKPHSEERKKNIGLAGLKVLDETVIKGIEYYLQFPFLSHKFIQKHYSLSWEVYRRYKREIINKNTSLESIELKRVSHVDSTVGLTVQNLVWLSENVTRFTVTQHLKQLGLDMNRVSFITCCKKLFNKLPKGCKDNKEDRQTVPEKLFAEWLKEEAVGFKYNVMVKFILPEKIQRYWVDFVLPNNVYVEIHGDYWHGNPEVYKPEQLSHRQIKKKNSDIRKKYLILKENPNIKYFEVWENDIINETEKWKQLQEQIKCILQSNR